MFDGTDPLLSNSTMHDFVRSYKENIKELAHYPTKLNSA